MSIINYHGKSNCFFCLKPIEGKGIEWEEQNNWVKNPKGKGLTKIHLHPLCAIKLAIRLIGDAFTANKKVEDKDKIRQWINNRMEK